MPLITTSSSPAYMAAAYQGWAMFSVGAALGVPQAQAVANWQELSDLNSHVGLWNEWGSFTRYRSFIFDTRRVQRNNLLRR